MHQSTTLSLSQTIWPRWVSRQFAALHIVQTLLSVTFGYFRSSRGYRFETIVEMKEAVTKVIDTLTQEDIHGAFQKLLERYNKCISAGGDYFEGDYSFMCVLSIKVPIRKKSGNLFNDPRICRCFFFFFVVCTCLHNINLENVCSAELNSNRIIECIYPTLSRSETCESMSLIH